MWIPDSLSHFHGVSSPAHISAVRAILLFYFLKMTCADDRLYMCASSLLVEDAQASCGIFWRPKPVEFGLTSAQAAPWYAGATLVSPVMVTDHVNIQTGVQPWKLQIFSPFLRFQRSGRRSADVLGLSVQSDIIETA